MALLIANAFNELDCPEMTDEFHQVMYADHEYSQPDGIVTEIQGESSDMNKGFGNP